MYRYSGNVQNTYEETQVEWKIADFCTIIENDDLGCCKSPKFFFVNISLFFELWPKCGIVPEDISLYLITEQYLDYSFEYNLGLKRIDNNVESLQEGSALTGSVSTGIYYYLNLSELKQRKSELMPSGVLTITCTLKRGTSHSTEPKALQNPELKKLISK